jgi:O-antigen/teichoic acid export membrane protein
MQRLDLSPDRIRLIASLAFNFIGKVPGIVAIFVILPLISRALGTAAYGELLSALALGSAFTLPFGGINAVGRRLLAAAVGAQDHGRQADVFVTTTFLMLTAAAALSTVLVCATANSWTAPAFVFVSLLPVLTGLFNVFDNTRASFNEHYITALFQLLFQTGIYAAVFLIGLPKGNVTVAGLTLQSPFVLASLMTVIVLLAQRPYLYRGKIKDLRTMLFPAFGVMLADGALSVSLNLSVYWLNLSGSAEMAAWVGTFARLFQSFLTPVLLIMFPITTYISMRWEKVARERQIRLHKLFILIGFVYGCIVGAAMAFAGPLYINRMFNLSMHGDSIDVLALSLFMGAVIAQKAYTMLLYAVSEARFISFGTATVSALGVGVAAVVSIWLSPMRVIDVFFLFMGSTLPVLLLYGGYRQARNILVYKVS